MNQIQADLGLQLWSLQEQIYYGISWILLLYVIYYLFKVSK